MTFKKSLQLSYRLYFDSATDEHPESPSRRGLNLKAIGYAS
jgi:hypothetical protein